MIKPGQVWRRSANTVCVVLTERRRGRPVLLSYIKGVPNTKFDVSLRNYDDFLARHTLIGINYQEVEK